MSCFPRACHIYLVKMLAQLSFSKRIYPSVNKFNNGVRFIKLIKMFSVHAQILFIYLFSCENGKSQLLS